MLMVGRAAETHGRDARVLGTCKERRERTRGPDEAAACLGLRAESAVVTCELQHDQVDREAFANAQTQRGVVEDLPIKIGPQERDADKPARRLGQTVMWLNIEQIADRTPTVHTRTVGRAIRARQTA